MKDILLSVTEVVSDTNTACGEQSVDRKGKSLTHDRLERDAFLINSFVAGGQVTAEPGKQTPGLVSYLPSYVMPVACKWAVIFIAAKPMCFRT